MLYYYTGLIHIGSHHVRLLCFYESLFESLYHKGHIYIYSCTFISNVQFKCLLWIALIITVFTNTEQDMAFGVLLHAVHQKQASRKLEFWKCAKMKFDPYISPMMITDSQMHEKSPKKQKSTQKGTWTFRNLCYLFITTFGNFWQLFSTYGSLWKLLLIFGNFWEVLATFINFWKLMAIYCNLC